MHVRVLGVDPGLTRCGLGVVDGSGGRAVSCVAVDVVRTSPDAPLAERLMTVGAVVERWIAEHQPDVVAVERVFSQHNVRTVMGTAQVSGVVALLAARAGLPVAFHTPSEVKAAVTGAGRADKQQVATMVTRLLGLPEAPRPADAADALALAICHCWRAPMLERLAQAQARSAELARVHRAKLAAARKAAGPGTGGAGLGVPRAESRTAADNAGAARLSASRTEPRRSADNAGAPRTGRGDLGIPKAAS